MQPGILHRNLSSRFPSPSDHQIFQVFDSLPLGIHFFYFEIAGKMPTVIFIKQIKRVQRSLFGVLLSKSALHVPLCHQSFICYMVQLVGKIAL